MASRSKTKQLVKKQRKGTTAIVRARVDDVEELLLKGYSRREIVKHAADNWKVRSRMADSYIAYANARLEKASRVHRKQELGKARRRLELLFRKAFDSDDVREARHCQEALSKLFGLDAPTKFEHDVHGEVEMDESQIDSAIAKVLEEIGLAASQPKAKARAKPKS